MPMMTSYHDVSYENTSSLEERIARVLRGALPPAIVRNIDFETLAHCPGRFFDEEFTGEYIANLFSAKVNGNFAYFLLVLKDKGTPQSLTGSARAWLKASAGASSEGSARSF